MKLFEFEGKKIWKNYGIPVPSGVLVSERELGTLVIPAWPAYMVKAQTLSGNRAQRNLITSATDPLQAEQQALSLLRRQPEFPELQQVLIEEDVSSSISVFISIAYSTSTRTPILLLGKNGGSGIEGRGHEVIRIPLDLVTDFPGSVVASLLSPFALSADQLDSLVLVIQKLWRCFQERDCLLAEINPLVWATGQWVALDAKVELDDDAAWRHGHMHASRSHLGRLPTTAELAAWQIDHNDHHGVAGSSYIELDGDIGILASGGGASLACLDALVALGGRPANYTEYSGNPPREKVRRLTEIVLSKTGLNGCWVVGATANFTDILETLSGFLDGLRALPVKPTYPFVIRRAGPHDQQAFELLRQASKKEGYDFRLYGAEAPMIATAKTMIEAVAEYKNHGHSR